MHTTSANNYATNSAENLLVRKYRPILSYNRIVSGLWLSLNIEFETEPVARVLRQLHSKPITYLMPPLAEA